METRYALALVVVMLAVSTAVTGTRTPAPDGLPRPWLSLDRGAKLLHLTCKPPAESSSWAAVHDLRLTALLKHHSVSFNVSLATWTPLMQRPKVNGGVIKTHNMSFRGTWSSKDVALDFLFPVSGNELARYFCTVGHDDHDRQSRNFTTGLTVNKAVIKDNFRVSVIDVHEVNVTWTKPEPAKLKEASVSRILVDAEGNDVSSPTSLFTTNGVRDFVYDDQDVLITRVNPNEDGSNFSLSLFVKAKAEGSYRYSCDVPYPQCTGPRAVSCTCCVSGSDPDPDRQKCPPVSKVSRSYFAAFVIFLIFSLLLLLVIVAGLLVYCLYKKHDRCSKDQRLVKLFASKREAGSPDEKEKLKNHDSKTEPSPPVIVTQPPTASDPSDSKNKSKVDAEEEPSGGASTVGKSSGQPNHSGPSPQHSRPRVTAADIHQQEEGAVAAPLQAGSSSSRPSPSHDPRGANGVILEEIEDDNHTPLQSSQLHMKMAQTGVPLFCKEDYSDQDVATGNQRLMQRDEPQSTGDSPLNRRRIRHDTH